MPNTSFQLIKGNSYCATGIFAAGLYRHNDKIILIDSGSDESSAKDLFNAIQKEQWAPKAIINTHCHPDHCGGNYFFQKKVPDIDIYATYDEKIFIEDPKWAPRCFCANAAPFAGLKTKHLAPRKSSTVTHTLPFEDHTITILDEPFKIITLPGHTPGSIGIITPDNILYAGDALFGQDTFTKHPILFYTDIGNSLASCKKLASLDVDASVLYHGGVIDNLHEVSEQHEKRILETMNAIFEMIQQEDLSIDALTQKVMQRYKIPGTMVSWTLTQTAVRAYLTQLEQEKRIELVIEDGLLKARTL